MFTKEMAKYQQKIYIKRGNATGKMHRTKTI